jgi:hypothetical protein
MRVFSLVLLSALILPACEDGSKRRRCEPALQQGCPANQTCGLQNDGTPDCFPIGAGKEGDACIEAADCGADLGCIRIHGVARCLRFCVPGDDPTLPCEAGADRTDPHRFSGEALCLGAAIDRPDIGICVLPCDPADDQCPADMACGLVLEAGFPACRPVGEQQAGEICDTVRECAPGLGCVPYGERFVCRAFRRETCAEGTVAWPVPGFLNVVTGDELTVCADCVSLGRIGSGNANISACPAPVTATKACAEDGSLPTRLDDGLQAERLDLAARATTSSFEPWWTAARRTDAGWFWGDADPVPDALTPVGEGNCAVWDAGRHVARPCEEAASAVCSLASQTGSQ